MIVLLCSALLSVAFRCGYLMLDLLELPRPQMTMRGSLIRLLTPLLLHLNGGFKLGSTEYAY